MINKVISIVVPAYNASLHIARCLDSLVGQSQECIEVVIIDDGSTDDTAEVCRAYGKEHSEITMKVVSKNNGGPLSARMHGVVHSVGEYVLFVDSDDAMRPGSISQLLTVVGCFKPDVVLFGYSRSPSALSEPVRGNLQARVLDKGDCLRRLCSTTSMNAMWGKLIRRACFPSYELKRCERMSMGEDLYQVIDIFDRADIFVGVAEKMYYYERNDRGLSANFKEEYLDSLGHSYGKLQKYAGVWEERFDLSGLLDRSKGMSLQQCLSVARCAASSLPEEDAARFFDRLHGCTFFSNLLRGDQSSLYCAAPYRVALSLLNRQYYTLAYWYLRCLTRVMHFVA